MQLIEAFLKQLKLSDFAGDIDVSSATRLVYSTDNSVYQLMPKVVLFPKSEQDIKTVFTLAKNYSADTVYFTLRGGGTSTNGQSLSDGIIVDCSRYLTKIKIINLKDKMVSVEPGVVLDQLNKELKKHGYFFPVNISTSSRCTLGGMANTNACGKGSMHYGRMSDNVIGLRAVLADGNLIESKIFSEDELEDADMRLLEICEQIQESVQKNQAEIASLYPKLVRRVTGYTLSEVNCRNGFNLNAILVGSEGTLAAITELKLKIEPLPKFTALVVIRYADFNTALKDGVVLRESHPEAIETIDDKIIQLAKSDILNYLLNEVDCEALTLVEFVADKENDLHHTLENFLQLLLAHPDSGRQSYHSTIDPAEIKSWWELRKKSVGLLAKTKGRKKPVSGVEDTLVPPEMLPEFIREFRAILDSEKLEYGMFGHIDSGCLHVRPAFDFSTSEGTALYYKITHKVAALAQRYGGILWGEHGKGFRSQYVPDVFGPTLYKELCKIKQVFDAENRLNPGKIAVPKDQKLIAIDGPPLRAKIDNQIQAQDQKLFSGALDCNGNGACFNYSAFDVICPSYKVTRDRVHSPKGRATLLRAWLANKGNKNLESATFDALAGCLGCKACATECPVQVDIPSLKAKFLQEYYKKHRRSLRSWLVARAEKIAYQQYYLPLSKNWLTRWVGLQDVPAVKKSPTKLVTFTPDEILARASEKTVVIIQDWLTSCYEPNIVEKTLAFLLKAGYEPLLLQAFENGKSWHTQGYLKQFSQKVKHNYKYLTPLVKNSIPLIGIDPSITLTYRNEYAEFDKALPVQLLQEFLHARLKTITLTPITQKIQFFPHCTEETNLGQLTKLWREVFQCFGIDCLVSQVGCCGMAGEYGYQVEQQTNSRALFKMSWEEQLTRERIVLASGFSCRAQIRRLTDYRVMHPVEHLIDCLK